MHGLPQMSVWLWFLCLVPILAVLILMMVFRWSGGRSGIVGWVLTLIVAYTLVRRPPSYFICRHFKRLMGYRMGAVHYLGRHDSLQCCRFSGWL